MSWLPVARMKTEQKEHRFKTFMVSFHTKMGHCKPQKNKKTKIKCPDLLETHLAQHSEVAKRQFKTRDTFTEIMCLECIYSFYFES